MSYNYDSLIFWPKKKIRRTFKEARAALGTDAEAAALRIFHERMSLFFITADETCNEVDDLVVKMYKHARKHLSPEAAFPKEESQGEDGNSEIAVEGSGEQVESAPAAPDYVPVEPIPVMKPFMDGNGVIDGITGVEFTPAERVAEIFSRMQAARGTPREDAELKMFALRMERLYENALESRSWVDEKEIFDMAAKGEALEDALFLRSITGGMK